MTSGFYLMHRGWMDNPIFSKTPFTEQQAWIWLIEEASFEPHKIRYHSKMIEVSRGQVPTSYRNLKDKFQWGNERVKRFLTLLVSESMIALETGTGFLVISICNYDKYQRPLIKSGTHPGTVVGTQSGTHPGTNINKGKELKEGKRKKRRVATTPLPTWLPLQDWEDFLEVKKRKERGASLTERQRTLLLNELLRLKEGGHDPGEVLRQSIARGWRYVFEIKGVPEWQKQEPSTDWLDKWAAK